MKTTSYKLNEHFDTYIGQQVASGRYKTAGEVITEALRQHEARFAREKRLLALLDEAMQDEVHDFEPTAFIAEMEAKYADRIAQ